MVIRPNDGVAEGVPEQDLPGSEPLGPGRHDVVLALHLVDQVAAQEPGVEAEQRKGHRERWQGQRVQVVAQALTHGHEADGGEPTQLHREQEHQQQREHVVGHRQPGGRDHHADPIEEPVGPARGHDRQRDGHGQRDDEGQTDEFAGDREPGGKHVGYRLPAHQRTAQVTVERAAQPRQVPLDRGPVEAHRLLQLRDLVRRRLRPEQLQRGVARDQVRARMNMRMLTPSMIGTAVSRRLPISLRAGEPSTAERTRGAGPDRSTTSLTSCSSRPHPRGSPCSPPPVGSGW